MEDFDSSFIEILDFLPNVLPQPSRVRKCKVCGGRICSYNPNDFCLPHTDRLRDEQAQEIVKENVEAFLSDFWAVWLEQEEQEFKDYLKSEGLVAAGYGDAVPPETVLLAIRSEFTVSTEQILAHNRKSHLIIPRQILMFLLRADCGLSFPEIGKRLGGRDHSTVMYAVERIKTRMVEDPSFVKIITRVQGRYAGSS